MTPVDWYVRLKLLISYDRIVFIYFSAIHVTEFLSRDAITKRGLCSKFPSIGHGRFAFVKTAIVCRHI